MRIGGVLINRNQANRALPNAVYHLNHLGFDSLIFVDNDSFDGSVEWVRRLRDPRVRIISTGPVGFVQTKWANIALKCLIEEEGCEWAFPIDCDTLWAAVGPDGGLVDFKEALRRLNLRSFCVGNYGFSAQRSLINRMGEDPAFLQECTGHWWRYHTFCTTYYYCLKQVIHHKDYSDRNMRWDIGNHPPNNRPGKDYPFIDSLRVYEMPMVNHEDFVRKIVNNSCGILPAYGYDWFRHGMGEFTKERLHEVMVHGHLHDYFDRTILEDANLVPRDGEILDGGRVRCFLGLTRLDYPEPKVVGELLSRPPKVDDIETLRRKAGSP